MNSQVNVHHPQLSTDQLNDLIVDSIQDIKGKNIVKLDLRHLEEAPTDFFIICEGDSNTQVKAISENIEKRVKQEAAIRILPMLKVLAMHFGFALTTSLSSSMFSIGSPVGFMS